MVEMNGEGTVAKKRVFVSFDFDNDRELRDLIVGQAKNPDSPFDVLDHSLKEAAPERDWESKAKAAITRSDVFLIMLGPKTRFCSGVRKEAVIATLLGKPRAQIIGYKNGDSSWAVESGGRVYEWDWENLKRILS